MLMDIISKFLIRKFKKELDWKNLFLFFILFLFSTITIYQQASSIKIFYYEGLLENIQALILVLIILITFVKRKLLGEIFGKYILYFRFVFFGFILFEEMSFITKNLCQFCDSFNSQGEFNLHNMPFFVNTVLTELPFIDEIYLYTVLTFSVILILSWGSYLPLIGNVKGIFLDKRYILNGSFIIIERILSQLIAAFSILPFMDNDMPWIIHPEFLELHLYIVLLFDLIEKIKIAQNKKKLKNI